MSQPDQAAIDTFTSFHAAHAAFMAPGAGDAEGDALMGTVPRSTGWTGARRRARL